MLGDGALETKKTKTSCTTKTPDSELEAGFLSAVTFSFCQ